jgi:hypothetical protein
VTTDTTFEQRLARAFQVDLPPAIAAALDARVAEAIELGSRGPSSRNARARRPTRKRAFAVLAIAAVLIGVAASPPVRRAFDSWFGGDFASVWDLASPIDQSAVDEGYRVTLVRAYGDPLALYVALTVEDLEARGHQEVGPGGVKVADDAGVEYPGYVGECCASTAGPAEGLLRFHVPAEAAHSGTRHLTVQVDGISVRAPDPEEATDDFAYETLWTSVGGSWSFDFDLDFHNRLDANPSVTASAKGVDITWQHLSVTPAATIITLSVAGLPPTTPDWGWDFGGRIEHDGDRLEFYSETGILDGATEPQPLLLELLDGRADLSGTWTITIDEMRTDIPDPDRNVTTDTRIITGPWVLTFEGAAVP